jgi:hypothetical protein
MCGFGHPFPLDPWARPDDRAPMTWAGRKSLLAVWAALAGGGLSAAAPASTAPEPRVQGLYFAKKACEPKPLPQFAETRDKLPAPIFAERPDWVAMYWKAWELAFKNFHSPAPGSGYVSPFIDAAFNQNIFLWDTCFMTMFCKYGHPLVPGIGSLDSIHAMWV